MFWESLPEKLGLKVNLIKARTCHPERILDGGNTSSIRWRAEEHRADSITKEVVKDLVEEFKRNQISRGLENTSYCSIAVKIHCDQGKSYKRRYLISFKELVRDDRSW